MKKFSLESLLKNPNSLSKLTGASALKKLMKPADTAYSKIKKPIDDIKILVENESLETDRDLDIKRGRQFLDRPLWLRHCKRHGYCRFHFSQNIWLSDVVLLHRLWKLLEPELHLTLETVCVYFTNADGTPISSDSVKTLANRKKKNKEKYDFSPAFSRDFRTKVFGYPPESLIKK